MHIGKAHNMIARVVFYTHTLTSQGEAFLAVRRTNMILLLCCFAGLYLVLTHVLYSLLFCSGFHTQEPHEIMLPSITNEKTPANTNQASASSKTAERKGKGCHALPCIRGMMNSRTTWFPIDSSKDYHYPGLFHTPFPQRMGFCEDMSRLPNYEQTDPHFLLSDV